MPSHSNPTRRVTAILDLLTLKTAGLRLTEIASTLGISKSTCLAIVTELNEAGYLVLDAATRRYRLGPALMAAGEVVHSFMPGLDELRAALTELSSDIGLACGANLLAGDDMVVVLRVGPTDPLDTAPVGQRTPFVAPYGFSFVAWSDREFFLDWLDRSSIAFEGAATQALEHSLAVARQRGFAVLREPGTRTSRSLALEVRYQRDRPGYREQLDAALTDLLSLGLHHDEIDPKKAYRFMSIHAPLKTSGLRARFSPHILGSPLEVSGQRILDYGRKLADLCSSLDAPVW